MINLKKLKKEKETIFLSIVVGLVALLLVASMFIQIRSVERSEQAGIEAMRDDELSTQIATYKSKYEENQEKIEDNQKKIDEYKESDNEEIEANQLVDTELKNANQLLGLTDVSGEGVIITLDNTKEAIYTSENLRSLINELKYAGAEAISINGNRVINLTDIITIDTRFIVMYGGNVRIQAPYIVKAIGDRKYLTSTLNLKNSGFVDLMKSSGLSITVEESSNIEIGKYDREINANYMKEA